MDLSIVDATYDSFMKMSEKEYDNSNIGRRSYLKLAGITGTGLGSGVGVGAFGTEFTQPSRAAPTVIDDFEDTDLSEYDFDRGSSGASIVSSPAQSGSYSLEFAGTNVEAISTSGLNAYPSAGDTFSFWVQASGGSDNLNVTWGVQDHQNRYYAKLKPSSSSLALFTYKSANGDQKDYTSDLSLSQDTWYKIEVNWATDGSQTVTLYDTSGSQLAQLTMADATWSSGGIGYDAYLSSGQTAYFDYVTLGSGGSGDGTETVIEDFERTDPISDYSSNTSLFSITTSSSDVIDGSKTLEATGEHPDIGSDTISTPRGYEYRCRIKLGAETAEPGILTCVQDTASPLDDCYRVHPDVGSGELKIGSMKDGAYSLLAKDSLPDLTVGTVYELAIELGSDTVKGVLYNLDGTTLAETDTVPDTTFSGGQLGFYTGGTTDFSSFYDTVTKSAISGSSGSNVIDDFEDGSLSAYTHDPTQENSSASIVSSSDGHPTYSGGQALAIENTNTEMISLPGDGLENYPSAGDKFGCWIRGTGGADISNFTYGVQDHENRYYVQVRFADNEIHWFKYDSGSGDWRDSASASLNQDVWYQLVVDWGTDGSHTVELKEKSGSKLATISASDSTWMDGGIGFDSYLASDGATVYFDYATIYRAPGGGTSYVTEYFDGDSTLSKLKEEYTGTMDAENDPVEVVSNASGVFREENAVKLTWPSVEGARQGQIFSKGNQIHQPRAGEKFSVMMSPSSDSRPIVYYGVTDTTRYSVEIYDNYMGTDDPPEYRVSYIVRRETRSDSSSSWEIEWQDSEIFDASRSEFSVSDTGWFELEINWHTNGRHAVTLYAWDGYTFLDRNEVRSYTTDQTSPVTQGTYGLRCGQGEVYFDNLFVGDGYPINYDEETTGVVARPESSVATETIEGIHATDFVERRPDPDNPSNWGITFNVGVSAGSYIQGSGEARPWVTAQEIEVSYPNYSNPEIIHPSTDNDWFGAHKYRSDDDLEAGTIKRGIVDRGLSAVSKASKIPIDLAVDLGEFFIKSGVVVANDTESFKLRWDYSNLPNGGKSLASTFAKFRVNSAEPNTWARFDVTTRTEFDNETLENNFHWSTVTPSFDSDSA